MIPYILHIAILLASFYLLYKLLLEKETFFSLNRYVLLFAVAISFSLPLYEIPVAWSVWDGEKVVEKITPSQEETIADNVEIPSIEQQMEQLTPADAAPDLLEQTPTSTQPSFLKSLSLWQILWFIYLTGIAIFAVHFLIQLGTLVYKIIRLDKLKDGKLWIVELDKDEPPYSFANYIFINPEMYDWETYNQIIAHEKIHVHQWHSVDMILAELLVVTQWFNPVAWQYRKMIENNLEFLTDQHMLLQGATPKTYQLNLLKVSVPQYPIGLAMNYNQSTLKKRIIMMNAKKSSVNSSWKYLAVLPILGLSAIFLNSTKAQISQTGKMTFKTVAQVEVPVVEGTTTEQTTIIAETVTEAVTTTVLKEESAVKEIADVTVVEEAIFDLKGLWQAQMEANLLCVRFDNSNLRTGNMWMMTECFKLSEFDAPPRGQGIFTVTRTAGKVVLTGKMEDDYGQGKYSFESSADFKTYLSKKGIKDVDDKYMFHLFTADISPAYFDFLRKEGIDEISKKELRDLAIHGLDMAYIKESLPVFRERGFTDVNVRKLVQLKIHNVDKEYVEAMSSIGFDELSLDDLKKGKIHNVDVDYVREIRGMGYQDFTFDDFVDFSIHNVDRELVESLAQVGFDNLPAKKLKAASIHNVTPRYIKELSAAGYDLNDIDELIRFKIHNVDTGFIKRMSALGYSNLSAKDISDAAIHNVDVSDVEALRKMGYDDLTIREVIKMSIHNVDADYVETLRDMGYTDLSIREVTNAKIHNLKPSFVHGLNDLGFKNISFDEVVKLKIHNVTADFIKRAQAKGMTDLSLNEYKKLKIHGIVQ
ncbi:MAG: M56 family metallopeptidase [Bacteroidota bacterium]